MGQVKRVIELPCEPMTQQAFEPYGQIIDAPEHPADYRPMFPVEFRCDGRPTVNVIWQPQGALSFSRLERHFAVTQTFFQLSGAPAIVCFARQTGSDIESLPDPDTVPGSLKLPRYSDVS